ncbi:hypothetical protein Dimus_038832 [Dionaea muscipula]
MAHYRPNRAVLVLATMSRGEFTQQCGEGRLENRGPLTTSARREGDERDDLVYARRRCRRAVESDILIQPDVHPQPVMVEMSFTPPIRPRVSVANDKMLEAERRIAQQSWNVVGYGETIAQYGRSWRGKGTMMGSIPPFQSGQDEEQQKEGEQQEEGEREEKRGVVGVSVVVVQP